MDINKNEFKLNVATLTLKELDTISKTHDLGFEFSSSKGKIKTLVLPSRNEVC